ncbi:MAG: hydrophobic/amphiphilic exporter (mainly bacteria), family [Candidatus Binatota bacterium]|nr:hydrophobic/amphiphilic exporter (mainly bacteria), family [Candidatus Binatota bacterium]
MNVAAPFIRRPIATTLVMFAFLLFGVAGYRVLPVSDLPNVDFPTLLVTAGLPGANPETMASAVATPLERQFSTIAGLASMSSTSQLGSTQITLQFDLSRDIDGAAQDVQTAITQAAPLLPAGMPTPPTFRKVNPADQPILYLGLTSATLPLWTLHENADTLLAQRISMVPGVAQVQIFGAQKYAVRVQLDPRALASRGIGLDEVERAVRSANVNLPTGTLSGRHRALTVQATGQLTNAAAYRPVIVAYRNGSPVRLEELGRVVDGVESDKTASWFADRESTRRAIILAVQRQPGENTVEVARAVMDLLPKIQAELSPSVDVQILFDRSASILASFNDVKLTMGIALVLVVLVIFLFLRNVRATLIPSLALPFSIIGTFAAMVPLGYSLDNLSLMALTLSIGFVVDDAIVMLENVVRHMEMGKPPLEAALDGSKEIGFTIVSMTLSLTAVFIPVLFLPGIVGRLFHEFAVTICIAILISGFVSLTLTPMLSARLLRAEGDERHGRFYAATERAFDGMLAVYDRTLRFVLRHRAATMVVSLLILAGTAVLFARIPKGFIPEEDQSAIFGITEATQGISFEEMSRHQEQVAEVLRAEPGVLSLFSTVVGASGTGGGTSNQGRVFLRLRPPSERPSIPAMIERLRGRLAGVPGIRVFLQPLPSIRLGGQLTKSLYQLTLQSPNTAELYRSATELETRLRELHSLRDVTSDLLLANPQVQVDIDRDRASTVGVTAEAIEDALFSAYGDRWVSTIYAPNNQYRVLLELDDRYQNDAAALALLYVRSSNGALVPLPAVARLSETVGPLTQNHSGQLPAVTLSFNLSPGVSLGQALDQVNAIAAKTLPPTVGTTLQGSAQAFAASLGGLGALLLIAILVMYIVLGILYESYVHPVTILSGLPSAGFGALLTLLAFGYELNLYGFVGLILLIGIVKKNAIMQIDFALQAERNESKSPMEAIYQGCLIRFRPIMMTTLAALLGALPIAVGIGAGADTRRPLGLAIVGGLLFSQLVTLYLTPVYYTYLEALAGAVRRRRRPETAVVPATAPAPAPAPAELPDRRRAAS